MPKKLISQVLNVEDWVDISMENPNSVHEYSNLLDDIKHILENVNSDIEDINVIDFDDEELFSQLTAEELYDIDFVYNNKVDNIFKRNNKGAYYLFLALLTMDDNNFASAAACCKRAVQLGENLGNLSLNSHMHSDLAKIVDVAKKCWYAG